MALFKRPPTGDAGLPPPDDGAYDDRPQDAYGQDPAEASPADSGTYQSDDDVYGDDPFGTRTPAGGGDPFEPEPVLADDEQNQPNSYNVRNILLLATGGFVLLLGAFLFSVGGGDDEARLAVEDGAGQIPAGALPPDLLAQPELRPGEMPPEDDLSALLNDPQVANGGSGAYGGYSEPPPPRTAYSDPSPPSGGGGGRAAASRGPSYLDERREAFFSALGLPSRRSVRAGDEAGDYGQGGQAQGGYPAGGYGAPYGAYPPGGQDGYAPPDGYAQGGAAQGVGPDGLTMASATTGGGGGSTGGGRRSGPPRMPSGSAAFRQASNTASAPFTPFTLATGTLIPIVLETSVNSELEGGLLIARTVEDVYDRTRRHVLIPRGSQIVSRYRGARAFGDRLEASASRLNLPDGRSVDFSEAGLYDTQGNAGLADQVDRHTASRFGAGALLTIAGVAAGVTGRRSDRGVVLIRNADGSVSEVGIGEEVRDEAVARGARGAQETFQRRAEQTINRENTIMLRAGLRGMVVLQQDIDMVRPYYDTAGLVPVGASPFDNRRPRGSTVGAPRLPAGPPGTLRTASARVR